MRAVSRSLPAFLSLATLLVALPASRARAEHPQDGPHADIRIAIEDDVVRYSIGINLAFLDEIVPPQRESLHAVAPMEVSPIRRGFEDFVRAENRVSINGKTVEPRFASFELSTDPDPANLPLFPKTGMRALIRGVSIIEYPAPSPPERVELTWGAYPVDLLAARMEGTEPAPMVIQALLTHDGTHRLITFSEAEPTFAWRASESAGADSFSPVPAPPEPEPPRTLPALSLALAIASLLGLSGAVARAHRGRSARGIALLALMCALLAIPTIGIGRVVLPRAGDDASPLRSDEAERIFLALHRNLYRAFDYTDESDIYDALARSVAGPELESLYQQVYRSLLQAENDGMVGVVTGMDPLALDVTDIRRTTDDAVPRAGAGTLTFSARHTWRVEGTVYHWGHSHTRTHEYEGEYRIAAIPDQGWRIVDHRILRQTRLDPRGAPAPLPEEF